MSTPAEIIKRRATVRRLAQGGASSRDIAVEVGVSKDTVLRDLKHPPTPRELQRERLAQRVTQAEDVVRQACAAAQAVTDARPSHTITDDATARRWHDALRDAAAALAAQADAFAEYYPCATDAPQETP